jgi:hypothetical protein
MSDGYDIEIRSNHLLIKSVPYVNANKEVKFGTLVSTLILANDITVKPDNHVVYFIGEYPCHDDGTPINSIINSSAAIKLGETLTINLTFSAKPKDGDHPDYYSKMTSYVNILSSYAQAIDPKVTAITFPVIKTTEEESVFKYLDSASARAGIGSATDKLGRINKIAIIGLGGTGSYVLDLIAKTPIKEIHLFDGDTFYQHNAFRSPGAPSGEELDEKLYKTSYFERQYAKMRRGIFSHPFYINPLNLHFLQEMDFVFLCIDSGEARKLIIQSLENFSIPFIDVGIGVYMNGDCIGGLLRVTASTPELRKHVWDKNRIPFSDGDNNEYTNNIQVADLNALNASLAVIRWKKMFGYYFDFEHEHFSVYTIDGNSLDNEDRP